MHLNAFSFLFPPRTDFGLTNQRKGECQRLFSSSLGWRDKPRQSGPISGCQRRSDSVSGTRQRQAAKPGEPTGVGIGSCDVMGFGCLGRAIGATYSASSARHSICGIKTSRSAEQNTNEAEANLKKKSSLLQLPERHKHMSYDVTDQRGHDESSMVYNYVALPETRLVDSLITDYSIIGELCSFCFYWFVLWNRSQRKRLFILSILR